MTVARPRIIAIVAVFNEADVLPACVEHLHASGVDTYVLDDGSTDGSLEIARSLVGRGVCAVESLPSANEFRLERILARKQALSEELDAHWFINHDADEFRDSPWPTVDLAHAIALVDAAGFNAIDFALLDFWPIAPDAPGGTDALAHLTHFERGHDYNKTQIRCWKKTGHTVDLTSTGGHDATFAGRRVFPLKFILRHYPVRSDAHGRRKIHAERLPRFTDDERARGWHVQYDDVQADATFVRDPRTLTCFDPVTTPVNISIEDVVRLAATIEMTRQRLNASGQALQQVEARAAQLTRDLDTLREHSLFAEAAHAETERTLSARINELTHERGSLMETVATQSMRACRAEAEHQSLTTALSLSRHTSTALQKDLNATAANLEVMTRERDRVQSEVSAFASSRTWRWTALLRRIAAAIGIR